MLVLCFWSVTGYSVIFCTVMSSVDAIISQFNLLFIFWREFYVVEPYMCIICRAVLTELFWGINLLIHNAMLSLKADPTPAAVVSTRLRGTTSHYTTVLVIAHWPFTCVSSQPQLAKQLILQTCQQIPHSILSLNTASLTGFLMVVLSPSRQMSWKYLMRIQVFWTWCCVGCTVPWSSRVKHSWTMIPWDFQNHLPTTRCHIPKELNVSSIADRTTSTSCTILEIHMWYHTAVTGT